MRVSSNEKFLQFDQESERKIKPKYNVPFEKKDSTVQVGITNFFSKLHKQRFDKVKENLKKNKNNFNIRYQALESGSEENKQVKKVNEEERSKAAEKKKDYQKTLERNNEVLPIKTEEPKLNTKDVLPLINVSKKEEIKVNDQKVELTNQQKPDEKIMHQAEELRDIKKSNKVIRKPNHLSMEGVSLYAMLSKQTRDLWNKK